MINMAFVSLQAGGSTTRSAGRITLTDDPDERRSPPPKADLPGDGPRRFAFRPYASGVHAAEVVPGAERDAVLALVPTAARTEDQVMIVQLPARRADRDRTPPAIAREYRVPVTWLPLPFGLHVQQ